MESADSRATKPLWLLQRHTSWRIELDPHMKKFLVQGLCSGTSKFLVIKDSEVKQTNSMTTMAQN